MREVQKVAAAVDPNLINDAALLRMGVEDACECGLFDKSLDKWEEITSGFQKWTVFKRIFRIPKKNSIGKKARDKG